ncbi:hypothetical protein HMPREF0742_00280 [Rothia aeria F0184]|uniref:Uncharacterized protein n=1 Tax=Rothia aeria F0184 TaxID=888019 RepID=U7V753_9MICC|nr:hypothetical protein HMPREF0742_00280 [Rothia aeria F0184]
MQSFISKNTPRADLRGIFRWWVVNIFVRNRQRLTYKPAFI